MFNPLAPYISIIDFAVGPILRVAFYLVVIGIAMVSFGYDPIGIAVGWVEEIIRSFIPGV